jgi:hypothetical protein
VYEPVWKPDRDRIVEAFRAGLASDPSSEAAGDAFLAVSYTNRNQRMMAISYASAAANANPRVWGPLYEAIAEPKHGVRYFAKGSIYVDGEFVAEVESVATECK